MVTPTVESAGEKEEKSSNKLKKAENCALVLSNVSLTSFQLQLDSLHVCAHCGCKVYEVGYSEAIDGKETAFCFMHCAR